MRKPSQSLAFSLLVWTFLTFFLPTAVWGYIGSDGACSLSTFVPFTVRNTSMTSLNTEERTNVGFSHMAGALMAMEHFNERNTSIVSQLTELVGDDCNVWFDNNNSFIYDTESITHAAADSLMSQIQTTATVPCAIAGPYNDLPARDLSVLALSMKIPQVAYRVFDPHFADAHFGPYSLSVSPDTLASSQMLVDFIVNSLNRSNFISILYSWTGLGVYKKEALGHALTGYGIRWMCAPYVNPNVHGNIDGLDALTAMTKIKASGYRTIILSMETVALDIQAVADAAETLHMNQGDYVYVVQDITEPAILYGNNTNITKMLAGSGTLLPSHFGPQGDLFNKAWRSQGKTEVDRLNAANPIAPGESGFVFAQDDFFQAFHIEYGSYWLYDAIMSLGIGACQAKKTKETTSTTANATNSTTTISSQNHLNSLRKVDFTGATGHVAFGGMSETNSGSYSRLFSTVGWVAYNMLPPLPSKEFVAFNMTHRIAFDENGNKGDWETVGTFYFHDGRTVPPELLRDQPEQNYLSDGLRIAGFVLLGTVWAFALLTVIWVFLNRQHRVLRASQPTFLYILACGAMIEASAIIAISFDESRGWTADQLGSACMAIPWLLSLGHVITYAGLFSKLWRVNKVLQFSRRKIEVKHVVGPLVALVLVALLILSLWTALDPLQWARVEINAVTGESFGHCSQQHMIAFVVPLMIVGLIPTLLTLFMAWKTKDVDEAYSESKWIFTLILVQLEVILFAVPLVALLRDVSTDGRYLGLVVIFWTFPMSTLAFIMLPKVRAHWTAVRSPPPNGQILKSKRGESTGGVKISGMEVSQAQPVQSQNRPHSENHSTAGP